MPITEFQLTDSFYVGFQLAQLGTEGKFNTEMIRLPDYSCNWNRFSSPEDVRHRVNGRPTDGCFSLTVEDVRFDAYATAVHDPLCGRDKENYSHCELRTVQKVKTVLDEPPKNAPKREKARRLAWRNHISKKATANIILPATA